MVASSTLQSRSQAAAPHDWLVPMWPAPAWVGAMMSSRSGGVSSAPYDHMNLGDHVQDDSVAVAHNRQILQEATGVRSVFLQQVHGVDAIALDEHSPETDRSLQADASYTQANGVACTIQVADCLPVLICHAHHRIVGAAHAGWRGLAGQQGKSALEQLLRHMRMQCPHADASGWMAWLGPCIGPKVFEVGNEVRNAFLLADTQAKRHFLPSHAPGKWLADLPGLARQHLAALNVQAVFGNNGSDDWCTFSRPERFFSYRRDGRTGRMAATVWLHADE